VRYCFGNKSKGEEFKKGSNERSNQERKEKAKVRKSPSNKTNHKKRVLQKVIAQLLSAESGDENEYEDERDSVSGEKVYDADDQEGDEERVNGHATTCDLADYEIKVKAMLSSNESKRERERVAIYFGYSMQRCAYC
jgi:hypothetical protein